MALPSRGRADHAVLLIDGLEHLTQRVLHGNVILFCPGSGGRHYRMGAAALQPDSSTRCNRSVESARQ